jgi:hypothetical protein
MPTLCSPFRSQDLQSRGAASMNAGIRLGQSILVRFDRPYAGNAFITLMYVNGVLCARTRSIRI